MIEICKNLFVGGEVDEQRIRGQKGWFFIHACKEPYHRQALGYSGRAASKDHPEYLIARRNSRLILNLVDVPDVKYIATEIVDAALDSIHDNIGANQILLHCNLGQSRSPTIGMLYLLKYTNRFNGMDLSQVIASFKEIYPSYNPAQGMADYTKNNWQRYQEAG